MRNWIQAGYLQLSDKNGISRESFEYFRTTIVGKEKLNKRANKSFLDQHDHDALIRKTRVALATASNLAIVGEEYQSALSNTFCNKEGIYYTPESICDAMFSDIPVPKNDKTLCDPCCGSGNFVMSAIRHGYQPENIYGYDTDPTAVEITKQRIYAATGYVSENIVCENFLDIATSLSGVFPLFDVIMTNPPWGKKLPRIEKIKYGKLLSAGRSLDTSSLFFFASLRVLKNDGFLALLLPESFFKIATFQNARRELLNYSLRSVRDFGKPFKGLLTKAQSFCMIKNPNTFKQVTCVNKYRSFERAQATFAENPAEIINFESCPDDAFVLSRFFDKPQLTLAGNARWGLGIVTGNNKKFCRDQDNDGYFPIIRGVDVRKNCLKKPTTFIPRDLSLYQQVAPVEIFEASEKILYRFISSNLVFYHDKDQSYCLNSVNMIVPEDKFPVSTASIVKLFNTDFFNWVFRKVFNTHKVLRSDIESMPIPVDFLNQNESFSEEDLLEYYDIERDSNGSFRVKGKNLQRFSR